MARYMSECIRYYYLNYDLDAGSCWICGVSLNMFSLYGVRERACMLSRLYNWLRFIFCHPPSPRSKRSHIKPSRYVLANQAIFHGPKHFLSVVKSRQGLSAVLEASQFFLVLFPKQSDIILILSLYSQLMITDNPSLFRLHSIHTLTNRNI